MYDVLIGATEQERNVHALAVLTRIRAKLEGREGPVALDVDGQVDSVLQQATSLSNLAAMFEGWMPWV